MMNANVAAAAAALKSLKAYDISPVFETEMPSFWGNPPIWIIDDARTYERDSYYCQVLSIAEHVGAHVDAPAHVKEGGKSIEQYEPGHFIGTYKKYDFSVYNPAAGWEVTMKEIREVEEKAGYKAEEGDIILTCYGWDQYYKPEATGPERSFYGMNSPGLSVEVDQYFMNAKIGMIGSDTCQGTIPSVNRVSPVSPPPCHTIYFLPNDILIFEGLTNLTKIPNEGLFVVTPLNIKNGSGSPISPIVFA
ncbi:MAG: cyclase family protein [Clostridiales Family XIII bacterium]|jgi:kynurenine formamidase|nr:cyclase family protein [Clostridiales Family XIII bacterium]